LAEAELQLAPFRFDVTPPLGHSICGGWIPSVASVSDPLECVGFVLLGAGEPIVICAVDWLALLNSAHLVWRRALAEAAGTHVDRVAVQCVHQHSAPLVCLDTQAIVAAAGGLEDVIQLDFFEDCLRRGRKAVAAALAAPRPVTKLAHGQAKVDKVASNRRVHRDDNGIVLKQRASSAPDEFLRGLPEGLIDPWLKTVAFYDGDDKIAACHYYATHPQSYYGDGIVTSDTAGLARKRRQAEEPDCLHLYFTGCAGNVAAGKYNDGAPEYRDVLTQRIYDGIVAAEAGLRPAPIATVEWRTVELPPPPAREDFSISALQAIIDDSENTVVDRARSAFMLSWCRRAQDGTPLALSSLHVDDVVLLHLPGECFVEYQLRAQSLRPDAFVAVAAYGDDGPWYIPVKEEYDKGGYEIKVAFCSPAVDDMLTAAMSELLASRCEGDQEY